MKFSFKPFAVAAACLLVTACHVPGFRQKAPAGQVVATIDGQEITLRELNAELGNLNLTDPKQRRAAQDQALQAIIVRKALAKAARDQGIEKSADFALQRNRADEQLLAQFLEQTTAAAVPAPTEDEANRFVSDNPDLFAQHKIFVVDQIRTQRPTDPAVLKQLEPMKTLEQIAAFFNEQHTPFARGMAQLDTSALGPQTTAAILKIAPTDVFVLPDNSLILVNQVRETKVEPLVGKAATDIALAYLKRQRVREAVGRTLSGVVKAASQKVSYNPAYAPKPFPSAPAAGSAVAPASAPVEPADPGPTLTTAHPASNSTAPTGPGI